MVLFWTNNLLLVQNRTIFTFVIQFTIKRADTKRADREASLILSLFISHLQR